MQNLKPLSNVTQLWASEKTGEPQHSKPIFQITVLLRLVGISYTNIQSQQNHFVGDIYYIRVKNVKHIKHRRANLRRKLALVFFIKFNRRFRSFISLNAETNEGGSDGSQTEKATKNMRLFNE